MSGSLFFPEDMDEEAIAAALAAGLTPEDFEAEEEDDERSEYDGDDEPDIFGL